MSHTLQQPDPLLGSASPRQDWNTSMGWNISIQGDVQWASYQTAQGNIAVQLTLSGECDVKIDFSQLVNELSLGTHICRFGKNVVHAYWLTFFDGESYFVPGPTQFGGHRHEQHSPLCSLTLSTGPQSIVQLRSLQWSLLRLH